MFLFISQFYNLGLNLSFVFSLLQGTEELSHELNEENPIVTASSVVSLRQGQEAAQGSTYLAQTISFTVEADLTPQATLEEILCAFCFLTRDDKCK